MTFAFYASGNATRVRKTLETLTTRERDLLSRVDFVFIDQRGNAPLKSVCEAAGIRFLEEDLEPIERRQRGLWVSDHLLGLLQAHTTDYLFIFGDKILKGGLLEQYANRIINLHPSLLPSFKGGGAIDRALDEQAFLLGNTAHFITEELDAGPVIMQSVIHRSAYRGYDSVLDLQIPMLIQLMRWLEAGRVQVGPGGVAIAGARYDAGAFVPALELPSLG